MPELRLTRPASTDLDAVTDIFRADEQAVMGAPLTTAADVRSDWARPSFSLADDAVVVRDGDAVVAYAEVHARRTWAVVAVTHQGMGIGTRLLAWVHDQARVRGWPDVGQTISDQAPDAIALLEAHGYRPTWDSWVFSIDLAGRPRHLPPGGVHIRLLDRPAEDAVAHGVIERAFSAWPGRQAVTVEDWLASHVDRADVEVLVATTTADGLVGVAVCLDEGGGEGWVEQLAVDADLRGRGVGRALLDAAFTRFAERGCTTAGLSTDSRTGARALYEHVGMHVIETLRRWTVQIDPPA